MVQRKPTPEEQLLKLIEGGAQGGQQPPASAPKRGFNPLKGLGKLAGIADYWKRAFQKKSAGSGAGTAAAVASPFEFSIDMKWANRGLAAMTAVALCYLAVDLAFFRPGRQDFLASVATSEPVYPRLSNGLENSIKTIEFYKDITRKRNPFLAPGIVEAPVETSEGAPEEAAGTPIANVMQNLKLVGISWGEEPLAMVEETSTGRTFFLKKGQEVRGMKVQTISKERVKVTYEGQEGELF